ncbi:MAG: hypothetical protein JWP87_2906 [Labilithrix sp.]|nr:hypothetical protein [Labilithrix sp.]
MKMKERFVFVLLVASVVSAFGGFALVSRGVSEGWAGVVIAIPMLVVVQRAMRVVSSPTAVEETAKADVPSAKG